MKRLVGVAWAPLAVLLLLSFGCTGTVFTVTGPGSGAPGALIQNDVSFAFESSGTGAGTNYVQQLSVDIPTAWTIDAAAYDLYDVGGGPSSVLFDSGTAAQSTSPTLCTASDSPVAVAPGYKRVYLTISKPSIPNNGSSAEVIGTLHLTLNPHASPAGVYYSQYWGTGQDASITAACGSDLQGNTSPIYTQKIKRYVIGSETDIDFQGAQGAFNADVIVNDGGTMDTTQLSVGDPATENLSFVTQTAAQVLAQNGYVPYGLPDNGQFWPNGGPSHVHLFYNNNNDGSNAYRDTTGTGTFNFNTFGQEITSYSEVHIFVASGPNENSTNTTLSRRAGTTAVRQPSALSKGFKSFLASKTASALLSTKAGSAAVRRVTPNLSVPTEFGFLDPLQTAVLNVTLTFTDNSTAVFSNVVVPAWTAVAIPPDLLGSAPDPIEYLIASSFILGGNYFNPAAYPLAANRDAAVPDGSALESPFQPSPISHFIWGIPLPLSTADQAKTLKNVEVDRVDGNSDTVFTFYGATGVKVGTVNAALTKTVLGGNNFALGDVFTYRLIATNNSGSAAANTQLHDTLPANVIFQSVNAPSGVNCTNNFSDVTCVDTNSLANGGSFTVDVTVQAVAPGPFVNTGQFTINDGNATATAVASAAAAVVAAAGAPTLSTWMLIGLAGALAAIALIRFRG